MDDGENIPFSYTCAKYSKQWADRKKAMIVEYVAMQEKQLWTVVAKTTLPEGKKIIGNRWVFEKNDDGRFRARSVDKGFCQIPGKHFQENHAPV